MSKWQVGDRAYLHIPNGQNHEPSLVEIVKIVDELAQLRWWDGSMSLGPTWPLRWLRDVSDLHRMVREAVRYD